ncbi:MAG: VOC family protein [Rhodospirillales bacterium]
MHAEASLFDGIFRQVAWVTNDMDRALAAYAADYGVKRWLELRNFSLPTGPDTHANVHIALAVRGGVELELIQPLGGDDRVYRQILTQNLGLQLHFHHICYRLITAEALAGVRHAAEARGRAVVLHGATATGTEYFYVDDRPTLGHHIEYIYYSPDDLRQLASAIPVD